MADVSAPLQEVTCPKGMQSLEGTLRPQEDTYFQDSRPGETPFPSGKTWMVVTDLFMEE